MPAFDPVRDAVLNSPHGQSPVSAGYPFPSPFAAGPSAAASNTLTPSISRRATDLSVLLNAEDDNPRRPARRSSLTHLLHPADDDDDNQLSAFQPFRRHEQQLQYHQQELDDDYRPTTASSHFTAPSPVPDSPNQSRPSSSSSSFPVPRPSSTPRSTVSPAMPPPPLPPTTLPYNPKKRLTPATTVLKPLTQAEMAMFKQYVGQGTERLTKRKRDRDQSADTREQPPAKKIAGDVGVVVEHYNSRPDVGVVQRQDSPIIGLKNFNNWVKSVLISRFAHPALVGEPISIAIPPREQRDKRLKGRVLELGCGKGGDIMKWIKAKISDYIGLDIAAVSIDQARQRWETLRGNRFSARFLAMDCYAHSLDEKLDERILRNPPFDVVSMQFCMHYAFETERKARCMLQNVSEYLRNGGAFIGTIPSHEFLLDRLDQIPADAKELSFGNSVYKIKFEDREKRTYGHKYSFFLRDAVDDVPEYVVLWDPFVQLAEEYGLHVVYKKEFHHVYEEFQEDPEFGPLMVRMKVVDEQGESSMDEDQWEAANIYIAFAFERRR